MADNPNQTRQALEQAQQILQNPVGALIGAFGGKKQPEGTVKFEKLPDGSREASAPTQAAGPIRVTVGKDNGDVTVVMDLKGDGKLETVVARSSGLTVTDGNGKVTNVQSPPILPNQHGPHTKFNLHDDAQLSAKDKNGTPEEMNEIARMAVQAVQDAAPPQPTPAASRSTARKVRH